MDVKCQCGENATHLWDCPCCQNITGMCCMCFQKHTTKNDSLAFCNECGDGICDVVADIAETMDELTKEKRHE